MCFLQLLEGEAGVGKTELAKTLAKILDTELIRLQCYEGLDQSSALYEWNYSRQILEVRLSELANHTKEDVEKNIFSEKFLLDRPLLKVSVFLNLTKVLWLCRFLFQGHSFVLQVEL